MSKRYDFFIIIMDIVYVGKMIILYLMKLF